MVVLEQELKKFIRDRSCHDSRRDLVAMVHSNNCTSDLNAWVSIFGEFAKAMDRKWILISFMAPYIIYLEGDRDCGGLLFLWILFREHITHFEEGRPLFVRKPDAKFNLANSHEGPSLHSPWST